MEQSPSNEAHKSFSRYVKWWPLLISVIVDGSCWWHTAHCRFTWRDRKSTHCAPPLRYFIALATQNSTLRSTGHDSAHRAQSSEMLLKLHVSGGVLSAALKWSVCQSLPGSWWGAEVDVWGKDGIRFIVTSLMINLDTTPAFLLWRYFLKFVCEWVRNMILMNENCITCMELSKQNTKNICILDFVGKIRLFLGFAQMDLL